jgi:hypothetical protein
MLRSIVSRAPKCFGFGNWQIDEQWFQGVLSNLKDSLMTQMETARIRQVCVDLCDAIRQGTFQELIRVISELRVREGNAMELDSSDSELVFGREQKDLLTDWDVAFSQPKYKGRALKSFLEFLDIQWGKMVELWEEGEGTNQSLCGTIVQSSCAGKSRLVDKLTLSLCCLLDLVWGI